MKLHSSLPTQVVVALGISLSHSVVYGKVIINEIATKASSEYICDGNDWIELYNDGYDTLSLANYHLHDDKGLDDAESFQFPSDAVMNPEEYLLLCMEMRIPVLEGDENVPVFDPMSPQFGIGGADTITLVRLSNPGITNEGNTTDYDDADQLISISKSNALVEVIDSVGPFPEDDNVRVGTSYALDSESGLFIYTSTPTPGAVNVISPLQSLAEYATELKAKLKEQNAMGTNFFGMDDRGYQVTDDKFPVVMDLHLTMDESDYATMMENASWEVYMPLAGASLKNTETGEEVWSRTVPGRIRPKGQSTLFMGICMGTKTIPFQLDLSTTDGSLNQTLFGVEKVYLRHHMNDFSFMRDYFFHRMLARFGLHHVRARKVQVYINDELHGFYTLLEAPDQDHVFARNFPDFDVEKFALYKVKSFALTCGLYTEEEYANATIRMNEREEVKQITGEYPPYDFERGEHQTDVAERGPFAIDGCKQDFWVDIWSKWTDVVVAYEDHDRDCGDMLVEEKLVDLDLGSNDYDNNMKDFLNKYFRGDRKCLPECSGSNFANEVDTENFLKTIAFYSTMLISDSPLISGNNFYLANSGDGLGWKMVSYDFNQAGIFYCEGVCDTRIIQW